MLQWANYPSSYSIVMVGWALKYIPLSAKHIAHRGPTLRHPPKSLKALADVLKLEGLMANDIDHTISQNIWLFTPWGRSNNLGLGSLRSNLGLGSLRSTIGLPSPRYQPGPITQTQCFQFSCGQLR